MTLFNILLIVFLGLPLIVVSVLYLRARCRIKGQNVEIQGHFNRQEYWRAHVANVENENKLLSEENEALKLTAANREAHIATIYQELHTSNRLNESQGKILGCTAGKLGVERRKTIKLEKLLKEKCQKPKLSKRTTY